MATRAEQFRSSSQRSGKPKHVSKKKAKKADWSHDKAHAGSKATHAMEVSEGRPSRESTRGSANRAKRGRRAQHHRGRTSGRSVGPRPPLPREEQEGPRLVTLNQCPSVTRERRQREPEAATLSSPDQRRGDRTACPASADRPSGIEVSTQSLRRILWVAARPCACLTIRASWRQRCSSGRHDHACPPLQDRRFARTRCAADVGTRLRCAPDRGRTRPHRRRRHRSRHLHGRLHAGQACAPSRSRLRALARSTRSSPDTPVEVAEAIMKMHRNPPAAGPRHRRKPRRVALADRHRPVRARAAYAGR